MDVLHAKAMQDFPVFEPGANKKPVKFSDSIKSIMKNERMREMKQRSTGATHGALNALSSYGGGYSGGGYGGGYSGMNSGYSAHENQRLSKAIIKQEVKEYKFDEVDGDMLKVSSMNV